MQDDKHQATIQALEYIHRHPGMFFSESAPAVVNFLEGFKMALAPADFDVVYANILRKRGWDAAAKAVWEQMREQKYDEAAINAEMLAIYLDVWREIEGRSPQETASTTEPASDHPNGNPKVE